MPGPFWLPDDVREGDYIEIGMLGAYGVAMTTRFNGYGEHEIAVVEDAPMASMYGLAPRSIPTVRTTAEEAGAQGRPPVAPQGQGRPAEEAVGAKTRSTFGCGSIISSGPSLRPGR